jgi:hypothetical protein
MARNLLFIETHQGLIYERKVVDVKTSFYAIRIDAYRFVAAEVGAETAAALLDEGRPLLLATQAELVRLASREHKTLVIFSGHQRDHAPTERNLPRKVRGSLVGPEHVAGRPVRIPSTDRRPAREVFKTPSGKRPARPAGVGAG